MKFLFVDLQDTHVIVDMVHKNNAIRLFFFLQRIFFSAKFSLLRIINIILIVWFGSQMGLF